MLKLSRVLLLIVVTTSAVTTCLADKLVGCDVPSGVSRKSRIQNPFPLLSKVAVVEFFNGTPDDTVIDGLQFTIAYSIELQSIPGYEVVPADVVRATMNDMGLNPAHLDAPDHRRRLANELGVDVVVVGVVTEYSPYYPTRLGFEIAWYSTNPHYYPASPGNRLTWDNADDEDISEWLIYQAEMALAKEQLETRTPLPPNWPDPRRFVTLPPPAKQPLYLPPAKPVMTHNSRYDSKDTKVVAALRNYNSLRDEAMSGGWQTYLQRSDNFIRFCCHMHISEMLTEHGGVEKTRTASTRRRSTKKARRFSTRARVLRSSFARAKRSRCRIR